MDNFNLRKIGGSGDQQRSSAERRSFYRNPYYEKRATAIGFAVGIVAGLILGKLFL
jgi:hypothetical protein